MPRRDLRGKRILVTGSSRGIGLAFATFATLAGARVLGVARTEPSLVDLPTENTTGGVPFYSITADLLDEEQRKQVRELVLQQFDGLDILVNSAGIGTTGAFLDIEEITLRNVMETNFFATAEMIRLFLPDLMMGIQPLIVNVSSVLGRRALPRQSAYCASKFAIQGFSDAIRAELVKANVGVLVVNPGLTKTEFPQHQAKQVGPPSFDHSQGQSAETVAKAMLNAIEADKSEITLSAQGRLWVLLSRFLPGVAEGIARRRLAKAK
jgi:short-subunit dehydrogenase